MPSTSVLKTNGSQNGNHELLLDLETRLTKDDHLALRLWLRFLSCSSRIESHLRSRLRQDFKTTLPRFDLMAQLERSPGGLRMNEISKRLMVSRGNVTGITDQLEKEGLVIRISDANDRRVVTLKLTELGLRKFRQISDRHQEWIVQAFEGLTRDEKQIMCALLKKLKSHLRPSALPSFSCSTARNK